MKYHDTGKAMSIETMISIRNSLDISSTHAGSPTDCGRGSIEGVWVRVRSPTSHCYWHGLAGGYAALVSGPAVQQNGETLDGG